MCTLVQHLCLRLVQLMHQAEESATSARVLYALYQSEMKEAYNLTDSPVYPSILAHDVHGLGVLPCCHVHVTAGRYKVETRDSDTILMSDTCNHCDTVMVYDVLGVIRCV